MALPAVRETGAGGLDALEPYFGGNHNLNMVLCHGGMLYIDEGRPMPGLIDKTVRNYMSQSQAQIQSFTGAKSSLGEIHDVKKLGCKSDTDVSWRCDVEVDITQFGNRTKGPASFRFVKGSDGWALGR